MFAKTLFDPEALAAQIARQQKHAWDLNTDIPWKMGVAPNKYLLPIDSDAVAFPGANPEQRLALSQLLGLIINSTIAEMEDVINKLKYTAWTEILRSYPVGPEMWTLGELFFEEENKHSLAFSRYIDSFCESFGIERKDLDTILPKAYGSLFLKAISQNSKWGGHAFWWVVAAVEEVSIELYKQLHDFRNEIDPLYHQLHLKHMEEESRHHNYAFLMLEVIHQRESSLSDYFHSKTDMVFGQVFSTSWVLAELNKVFEAKKLKKVHPFFDVIASCGPLFETLSPAELGKRLFVTAPYISLMLNSAHHKKTSTIAQQQRTLSIPFPKPRNVPTFAKQK